MRNPLSLFEMYRVGVRGVKRLPFRYVRQPIVRAGSRLPLLLLAVTVQIGPSGPAAAQCPALEAADRQGSPPAASRGLACRFDETLTRMFTPRTAPSGAYRVFVTEARLDEVTGAFRMLAPAPNARGAWTTQALDPLDAFGEAGAYNRSKVARLYVGLRARVAHGPIIEGGRTVASITLISPYPDSSLTRLEPGTLIIELRIPAERDGGR